MKVPSTYRGVWLVVIVIVLVAATVGTLWYGRRPRAVPKSHHGRESSSPSGSPGSAPGGRQSGRPDARSARPSSPAVGPMGSMSAGGASPPPVPGNRGSTGRDLSAKCSLHVQRLARAISMYRVDYDDHLPVAQRWCDGTYPYLMSKSLYRCPARPDAPGYAFNRNLSGARTRDARNLATVVMLFDSSAGTTNATDTGESLCRPPRHVVGNSIGYLDGHVVLCGPHSGSPMVWK